MARGNAHPPPIIRGRFNWYDIVARLRAEPGKPMLLDEMKDIEGVTSVANQVRGQRSPALRMDDGEVIPNVRNSYVVNGKRHGDLVLTYHKKEED
jgi:hypothetical protein